MTDLERAIEYYTRLRVPQRTAARMTGTDRRRLGRALRKRGLSRSMSEARRLTAARQREHQETIREAGRLYHEHPFVSFAEVGRALGVGTKSAGGYVRTYCEELGIVFEHPYERRRRRAVCVGALQSRLPYKRRRRRICELLGLTDGQYHTAAAQARTKGITDSPDALALCADTLDRLGHTRTAIARLLRISPTTALSYIRRHRD